MVSPHRRDVAVARVVRGILRATEAEVATERAACASIAAEAADHFAAEAGRAEAAKEYGEARACEAVARECARIARAIQERGVITVASGASA